MQYACRDYALRLSEIGAHASMSRPGTPQDNAKAESFMHTLKAEEVDGKAYQPKNRIWPVPVWRRIGHFQWDDPGSLAPRRSPHG